MNQLRDCHLAAVVAVNQIAASYANYSENVDKAAHGTPSGGSNKTAEPLESKVAMRSECNTNGSAGIQLIVVYLRK